MQSQTRNKTRQEQRKAQFLQGQVIQQQKQALNEDDLSRSQFDRQKQSDSNGQQGRWTTLEHKSFVEALSLYGKNWKKVEEHVGTRSGAQIRSHAQKFFNRLEREFNKQFNGLKSSEIKVLFENKALHNLEFGEKDSSKKKERSNSIHSIQSNDMMSLEEDQDQQGSEPNNVQNTQNLLSLLENQEQQKVLSQLNALSQQQQPGCDGILNLTFKSCQDMFPTLIQYIKKAGESPYPEEVLKQYQALTQSLLLNRSLQLMQAYQNLKENHNFQQEIPNILNQPTVGDEVQKVEEDPVLKKKHSVSNIGQDESFLHFIIAKYSKFFNKKIPTLNEIADLSQKRIQIDNTESQARSRRGSFVFYNEEEEENETKYQQLKKVKESNDSFITRKDTA